MLFIKLKLENMKNTHYKLILLGIFFTNFTSVKCNILF